LPGVTMQHDKRDAVRFVPQKDVFAALDSGITLVGKISDISTGGLAFEHIANLDSMRPSPKSVDVFVAGGGFYLAGLPCSKVYDILLKDDVPLRALFIPKRCGVKFTALNDRQLKKLDYLLHNFIEYAA